MQRKNRGYKRGEPFRDSTLFVIATEGAVREKEYFEELGSRSSRIRIKVLNQQDQHRCSPKWVLDCAATYSSEIGLVNEDQLWLVMDVDRWPENQLREIDHACSNNDNWNLALSNPCFEVWLYMHIDDISTSTSTTCGELKTELGQKFKGGYSKREFVDRIDLAHGRAERTDDQPNHFIPSRMRTKLYLLTKEVFKVLGKSTD